MYIRLFKLFISGNKKKLRTIQGEITKFTGFCKKSFCCRTSTKYKGNTHTLKQLQWLWTTALNMHWICCLGCLPQKYQTIRKPSFKSLIEANVVHVQWEHLTTLFPIQSLKEENLIFSSAREHLSRIFQVLLVSCSWPLVRDHLLKMAV